MNCAESQDLLLDLAYGELPPARAAEVEEHVLGCASCRAEKAQLDEARRAAAPLRDPEEPPAGFDEPILRAARAEAGMQADGTPGPVVEVSASVKPLGLQAARLDPHARMRGGGGRPPPRWWRRAAVVGTIAAAAGLAVVVTSSVTSHAPRLPVQEEVAPIQVRAPGAPVPNALDRALSPGDERAARPENKPARAREPVPPPTAPAPPAAKKEPNAQPVKAKPLLRDRQVAGAMESERDGTVPGSAKRSQSEPARAVQGPQSDARRPRAEAPPAVKTGEREVRAPERGEAIVGGAFSGRAGEKERGAALAKVPSAPPPPPQEAPQVPLRSSVPPAPFATAPAAPLAASPSVVEAVGQANPDPLEDQASAARRRGEYARAAFLYREASALRRQSDPARAAWDMAHAVECLAAGGQVDDAVAVRKELLRTFPDHAGPKAAANSALRSVRLPPDEDRPAPVK